MIEHRRVLLDTGPLVAMRSLRDQHRPRVLEIAALLPSVVYTTWPVVVEATYLLRHDPREVRAVLGSLGRELRLIPQGDEAAHSMRAVLEKYSDQEFSVADASLMVAAASGHFDAIFTVDRKDFSIFIEGQSLPLTILD